jgi:hypothetical protein
MDDRDRHFKAEVDAVVRRWAAGDEYEYWRLWKKLGNASMDRTQGDATKKAALKTKLMAKTSGHCEDCRRQFSKAELQMHRVDASFAHQARGNFGYFEGNVALLCAACHSRR